MFAAPQCPTCPMETSTCMQHEQRVPPCCAGLAFQLDDHQHAQFADKILQIVAPTFPHPVAHGSGADPSDLHTTLLLYLWAVADSQAEFRTHRSKTKETCLIKEVDKRLHRNTYDFHSDPGPGCNQNCNIHQYHNGLADNVYRCDHVFPKRRKPKVEQGMCTVPGDTLIGEAKWWKTDTKLGSPETRQKVAEVEHVRSGFAKCLVWWCARYPSNANLTWKYTHFEVTFLNAQDCNDCKLRLSSLGLLLHWRS